jgi:hypothetical protein
VNLIQAMALLSVTAVSATIAPAATSQERMHAGLWEMTTTKDGATINTGTRCMTAAETAGNNGDAKALRDTLEKSFAKASCVVKDMAATGKSISYVADCGTGARAHTLSSVGEYRGDTVEIRLTTKHGTTLDTMITKGHRVGACA